MSLNFFLSKGGFAFVVFSSYFLIKFFFFAPGFLTAKRARFIYFETLSQGSRKAFFQSKITFLK